MNEQFTFQVNISPGDAPYAEASLRRLAKQHACITQRLLIVDCCKPQKTKLLDPAVKFAEPHFSMRLNYICSLADQLLKENLFTRVYYLLPNDSLIKYLSKKYLNNVIKQTHGAGGTAQMAYWAGIELSTTQFVLHYDGDMVLYQEPEYQWWREAEHLMHNKAKIFSAIPRNAPPTLRTGDMPTFFEGTTIVSKNKYWLHNWFSTRVFLLDKTRFEAHLPLVRGKLKWELFLRKILLRAFPLDPEIIMFKKLGNEGNFKRLILKSEKAWTLHPITKSTEFIKNLPIIYEMIDNKMLPEPQWGNEDLILNQWTRLINRKNTTN